MVMVPDFTVPTSLLVPEVRLVPRSHVPPGRTVPCSGVEKSTRTLHFPSCSSASAYSLPPQLSRLWTRCHHAPE